MRLTVSDEPTGLWASFCIDEIVTQASDTAYIVNKQRINKLRLIFSFFFVDNNNDNNCNYINSISRNSNNDISNDNTTKFV